MHTDYEIREEQSVLDKYNAVMAEEAAQQAFNEMEAYAGQVLNEMQASHQIVNPAIDAALELCGSGYYEGSRTQMHVDIITLVTRDGKSAIWAGRMISLINDWLAFFNR